ncbi:MAG TPA: cation-transporting P-type ATPase, partial [Burkholderiaceae bacterium]|nr:cation-transporting P-type ATPase [Burkholderiaceae bacterium]
MRHAISAERLEGLVGSLHGLSAAEVDARRRRFGANDILAPVSSPWRTLVRETVGDPMIWFLGATALLFAWLGDYAEAAVLAAALIPIAGMDAYLHRRTQASTEALAGRLAATANVMRDGALIGVAATELVPGDLAVIVEGQGFPADGVIVDGTQIQADESALTGEALPVRKRAWQPNADGHVPSVIGHEFWGAAGTRLLTGEARLRIVFTGGETLYGQIVRSARAGQQERTPLQRALASLVTVLVVAASVLCLALAATRYLQGYGLLDALLSAVTLAVAALPEEFPVVFTFFLGVGVYRLARRRALVRRAVVVENIGRVTCICSDKTGTLTEGRLRLTHRLPAVSERKIVGPVPAADDQLLSASAIASRVGGADPMDLAIAELAPAPPQRVATFPFTEDRRREVGIVAAEDGMFIAAVKGAPETVMPMTSLTPSERSAWLEQTQQLAASGHKVIACARRRLANWPGGEPDRDYEFLGLLAFEDPVREGVVEAVRQAQAAGIRVIMVTGDHPATARAIAREIGIGTEAPRVVEGARLAEHLQGGDRGRVDFDVVARCLPAQKLDLVHALRARGEIVAVTGDGVNDVPALQGADIGIAMGERGTRSAREIASIVLLDDNFRTIVRAMAEGRQLFENLKLSFAYLLMLHIPLVLTAAFIPFAGFPLLYLPIHIVWLELLMHPTALLVFQQVAAPQALRPAPRRARLRFFDAGEWTTIGLVAAILTGVVVLGYVRSLGGTHDVEHARTMAMVALVVASAALTAGLAGLRSRSALAAISATLLSAVVLIQTPTLAALLHLSPLH